MELKQVLSKLSSLRLDPQVEHRTHAQIVEAFKDTPLFQSQYRLGPKERPDFFCNGVVVELKVNSAKAKQIYRQLKRYASHDEVTSIVLVTGKRMTLPKKIEGKPVHIIWIGISWL